MMTKKPAWTEVTSFSPISVYRSYQKSNMDRANELQSNIIILMMTKKSAVILTENQD